MAVTRCISALCLMLALPAIPLAAMPRRSPVAYPGACRAGVPHGQDVPYRVKKVLSPRKRGGFTIVVATVGRDYFNREDMTSLAARLKNEFPEAEKLKVALLDDENVVRLFFSGQLEYPEFGKAQRGLYYRNRIRRKEYIQFSANPGKPQNEVRLWVK